MISNVTCAYCARRAEGGALRVDKGSGPASALGTGHVHPGFMADQVDTGDLLVTGQQFELSLGIGVGFGSARAAMDQVMVADADSVDQGEAKGLVE